MKSSLLICMLAALVVAALVGTGHAQTLSLGMVVPNPVPQDMNCPADIKMHSFPVGTACYSGTITDCTGLADIAFTFGVLNPNGTAGTIVLFSHGDGTTLDFATSQNFDSSIVNWYDQKGFQTVQVIWQQASTTNGTLVAWEQSQSSLNNGTMPTSIKQAACRPATLLNYLKGPNVYTQGGMCAEGVSAGSAAIAYSMTEYGADYLDAVEFHSGPPLADIRAGCADPASSQNVCEGTENFCQTGMEGGWSDFLQYVMGANLDIDRWTNISPSSPSCAVKNPNPNATTYKHMSVVDGLTDSTFDHPSTAVNIWVCAPQGLSNGVCGGSNQESPPNNTAGEGWFFADQILKFGSARALNLYRVDNCSNSEDVGAGVVPAFAKNGVCPNGTDEIKMDMKANCVHHTHTTHTPHIIESR